MESVLGTLVLIFVIYLLVYEFRDNRRAKKQLNGEFTFDSTKLKPLSSIIDVKSELTGQQTKKKFRVIVLFDDGSKYIKVVQPDKKENVNTWMHQRLSINQETLDDILAEAQDCHDNACIENL